MARDPDGKPNLRRLPGLEDEVSATDAGGAGSVDGVQLQQLVATAIGVLRRRFHIVLIVFLAAMLPALTYAVTAVPKYQASGVLQVSDGGGLTSPGALLELASGTGTQATVQTEVEIIRRRDFIVGVLKNLNLHAESPEVPNLVTANWEVTLGGVTPVPDWLKEFRVAVGRADLQRDHTRPFRLRVVAQEEGVTLSSPEHGSVLVHPGMTETLGPLTFELRMTPWSPGTEHQLIIVPDGALFEKYSDRIGVAPIGSFREPTNLVQVSVSHEDRETAQSVVQAMMDAYIQQSIDWQAYSASKTAGFIEAQLELVRADLKDAEERLQRFSEKEGAIQLETQARVAIENVAALEVERLQLLLQSQTIEAVRTEFGRGKRGRPNRMTSNFFDDPVLAQNIAALTEAESRHAVLKGTLTGDHPQLNRARTEVELRRKEVRQLLAASEASLTERRTRLESEIASALEGLSGFPDKQLEYARLAREAQVSQKLFTLLLEKLQEAEIIRAATTVDKRIVDSAEYPYERASPDRRKILVVGTTVGLGLGLALALLLHAMQIRLDSVESIKDVARLPVYGTIPLVEDLVSERAGVETVWSNPHHPFVEALRLLAVNLTMLPREPDRCPIIAVTSSQPGEGKSTVAAHLATALSRAGQKVMLVDLDLRRSVQHRIWGCPRGPGVTESLVSLSDDLATGASFFVDPTTRVTLLPAGKVPPDPLAVVMSPRLARLIQQLALGHEYVVLDCPPAFVAEASKIAEFSDCVLVVARPGVTERANLYAGTDRLSQLAVRLGLVLNAVGREHADDYYGSEYAYYSPQENEPKKDSRKSGNAKTQTSHAESTGS